MAVSCRLVWASSISLALVSVASAQGLPPPRQSDYARRVTRASQPVASETYARGVILRGTATERAKIRTALDQLRRLPTGKKLLKALGKTKRTTTIRVSDEEGGSASPLDEEATTPDFLGQPGRGSDVEVTWNPEFSPNGLPALIVLGHELVHAQHMTTGTEDPGFQVGPDGEETPMSEVQATGLGPFRFSENLLRLEWNAAGKTPKLPLRQSYDDPGLPACKHCQSLRPKIPYREDYDPEEDERYPFDDEFDDDELEDDEPLPARPRRKGIVQRLGGRD